jgi:hypothetical protein
MSISFARIRANVPATLHCVRQDIGDFMNKKRRKAPDLSREERRWLHELEVQGYCVINGFWSMEKAGDMKIKLEAYLREGRNMDFECGAYMRFRDNTGTDDGVRRIYHVDKLVPELSEFRFNALISRISEAYYGFPFHSGSLVFQHNLQSTANTRFHHIDWFGKQFKPFLYLDDVDEGNGPFTYIKRSHRSHILRLKKQLLGNETGSSTSFDEHDVASVIHNEVKICGKAGTLILADVRGLHRGSPQSERSRSILVNYMYPNPGEVFMDK